MGASPIGDAAVDRSRDSGVAHPRGGGGSMRAGM